MVRIVYGLILQHQMNIITYTVYCEMFYSLYNSGWFLDGINIFGNRDYSQSPS